MSIKKDLYQKFCTENDVPIFFQPWWLDAVCEKNKWDCALVEKGDKVIAVMPYMIYKNGPFTFIGMPKLTPYLGPWVIYNQNQKHTKRLTYEKKIYNQLIKALPNYSKFSQSFHYEVTNWLPFYWEGFEQTTRYTYLIEPILKEEAFKNLQDKTRWEIRKAKKILQIDKAGHIDAFYDLVKMTFERQNKKVPYSKAFLNRLNSALENNGRRILLMARDDNGTIHAGAYFVWDKDMVYYLIGGSNPEFRKSGAVSLLIWKAIEITCEQGKTFNFEGSMHEPIEKNFRAFSARQTPYFKITHIPSFFLKFKNLL